MKNAILSAFFSALLLLTSPASAVELVMLDSRACDWCDLWHEEIGPIYPLTDEGKLAPLRIVDVFDPWPEDLKNIVNDRFTPSFVLVENGVEIGRLRGYAGEDFFWYLLGEVMDKLPQQE